MSKQKDSPINFEINACLMASGQGSNACAILDQLHSIKRKYLKVEHLVVNNPESALYLNKEKMPVKVHLISSSKKSRKEFEFELLDYLKKHKVDLLFLAGFMRLLSLEFIQAFHKSSKLYNKWHDCPIINIHPSLLPKYPGLNAYERSFASDDSSGGVSLHFIDGGMDTGPILMQKSFAKNQEDDLASFKQRGLSLEHQMYQSLVKKINDEGHPYADL